MSSNDRDRRADGRPEQARPRDRTGRPLPYDTAEVELAEEHDPATVEEALEVGVRLWGEQRYFEAHECLEQVWHAAPPDDEDLWQGVIQVAVAAVHLQRGNPDGAIALFGRARERLERYPPTHRGIDVATARRWCVDAAAELRAGGEPSLPSFPAADGGAWFTTDPSALVPSEEPTPIADEPAWVAAGRPRRPRTRGSS